MLTERVDPLDVLAISERAKRAEKDTANATAEVVKMKDSIATLERDFSNLKNNFAVVKKSKP
jgi:hypothetical protein